MSEPTSDFSHLWNDLPFDERVRLMPHSIEAHKLHIWQCKQKAIRSHKRYMMELDDLMKNLDVELKNALDKKKALLSK